MAGISTITGQVIDRSGGKKGTNVNGTKIGAGSQTPAPSTSKKVDAQAKSKTASTVDNTTNEYIEGTLNVLPNSDFSARQIYGIKGVGAPFTGMYYIKSATHSIADTYTVSCNVLMVQKKIAKSKNISSVSDKMEVKSEGDPRFQVIIVKNGDTLSELGAKYGCPYTYLAEINNISNPDLIQAGMSLKVPAN